MDGHVVCTGAGGVRQSGLAVVKECMDGCLEAVMKASRAHRMPRSDAGSRGR